MAMTTPVATAMHGNSNSNNDNNANVNGDRESASRYFRDSTANSVPDLNIDGFCCAVA